MLYGDTTEHSQNMVRFYGDPPIKVRAVKQSLPIQLLVCVVAGAFFGNNLSPYVASCILTLSTLIQDTLILFLPIIIWSYLASAIISFQRNALWLILSIAGLVATSNALALFVVYGVGNTFYHCLSHNISVQLGSTQTIEALWRLPISPFLATHQATLGAIVIGLVHGLKPTPWLHTFISRAKSLSSVFLGSFFIPIVPLYVAGFVVKLVREGTLVALMNQCIRIVLLGWVVLALYLWMMYWVSARCSTKKAAQYIRSMMPAGLVGFGTMSSMAALPLTIEASAQNLEEDKEYAPLVVPLTTSNHLIGDSISIGLAAVSLKASVEQCFPDFGMYAIFVFFYCITKFSVAAIPGGGVVIILPVLAQYLSLNQDITTLVATLYILQDSILTGSNIMGNGAFALISRTILKPLIQKSVNTHAPSKTSSTDTPSARV